MLESTSVLLKRLENRDLALEPTRRVPALRAAERTAPQSRDADDDEGSRHPAARPSRRDRGGGFDPYNSR